MEVIEKVLAFLTSAEGASATIAVVLEFAFRLIPSKKPLGILQVVGQVAKAAGEALVKIGNLLNKVLPQNIKE